MQCPKKAICDIIGTKLIMSEAWEENNCQICIIFWIINTQEKGMAQNIHKPTDDQLLILT